MTRRSDRLEVASFDLADTEALAAAGRLLATRQEAQRRIEPGLSAAYEDAGTATAEVAALAAKPGASGSIARRGGVVVGYLLGAPRAASWGPNMWVEGAGHAVAIGDPEIVRDLYGHAAAGWVAAGLTNHYVVVPATDAALLDAWFRVSFGVQHVHAIRDVPGVDETFPLPPGVTIRRAERRDITVLGRLEVALNEHQTRSPVFSPLAPPSLEDATNEWEEEFDDPAFMTEARGLGAGRALGESVLAWARDAGHPTVVTDWRETNLLSSRTWPRLGFRPTYRRLFRAIA